MCRSEYLALDIEVYFKREVTRRLTFVKHRQHGSWLEQSVELHVVLAHQLEARHEVRVVDEALARGGGLQRQQADVQRMEQGAHERAATVVVVGKYSCSSCSSTNVLA